MTAATVSQYHEAGEAPTKEAELKKVEQDKEMTDITSLSNIAVKTGLTPNQLIEAYQSPDGSEKYDTKSLSEDFNGGKGIQEVRMRQQEFEEKKGEIEVEQQTSEVEMQINKKPDFLAEILARGPKSGCSPEKIQEEQNNSDQDNSR